MPGRTIHFFMIVPPRRMIDAMTLDQCGLGDNRRRLMGTTRGKSLPREDAARESYEDFPTLQYAWSHLSSCSLRYNPRSIRMIQRVSRKSWGRLITESATLPARG